MKKIRQRWYAAGIAAAAAGAMLAILLPGAATSGPDRPANNILARALDIERGRATPGPHEQLVSSGLLYPVLEASGALEERANAVGGGKGGANGASCASKFAGGGSGASVNIRVNQDCSLRRQSEEVIAANPTNPDNLIAGQNDSVIGFNHCGYDFSFDGGKTWGSYVPPFWQFVLLDGHTSDACSDPSVSFDADGNAYATGIIFDVNSAANAIVVAKSDKSLGGAFFHSPANLSFQQYRDVPLGVVANDNDPNVAHDKEFIVADSWQSSPKKNNVYLTWTRFTDVNAPIYFSQSTNGGATWSPGIEISGANAAICTIGSGSADPNACDQDQGSDPIVGPDGTIYVSFFNQNVPGAGHNQHVVVQCPGTADCSNPANWSTPVRIQEDFGGQPLGPNAITGCPAGRSCLPPNGYRVQDRTYGSISIDASGKLYFVFSDFRNGGPPCTGSAVTAQPPCDQDVFYSYSTDGGQTWSPAVKLTPAGSAQWQPWSAVTKNGSVLYAAYYDRKYGNCELDGCNDITLTKITNPATASPSISSTRITTSSMPNMVVANNPIQAGFLGDYMWVATDPKGRALIVWGDNRGQNGAVEQDIYFARTP